MNEKDLEVVLKGFTTLLAGLEKAVSEAKSELQLLLADWNVVRASKPVSPDDRAIKWLQRRLEAVKEKHPSIRYEFLKNEGGLITGLRYIAEDEEVKVNIERLSKWSFEKSASKPNLEKNDKHQGTE